VAEPYTIIAHRGASNAQPENTAAAFDAAVEQGADGIELDLQLSADKVPVVFHDPTLARLGLRRWHVSQYGWAELKRLDVGRWFTGAASTHRMLRLEDVLEEWGRRTRLCLEIKNYEGREGRVRHAHLAHATAAAVKRHGLTDAVEILSFHDEALRDVHAVAPDLACVRNVRWATGVRRLLMLREAWLVAICVAVDRFGPEHADRLSRFRKPLYAYTCDTAAQLRRALAVGVPPFITNEPAATRAWLRANA